MSFTRFHDDPCRVNKSLQESTDVGRYIMNVPGNGSLPTFHLDPFIRAQKWGGNLMKNSIQIESDLKGMTRTFNRDDIELNEYKINAANKNNIKTSKNGYEKIVYPLSRDLSTEQSRATHPAWITKDDTQSHFSFLPLDPQLNLFVPFQRNLNTRILERDRFIPEIPHMNYLYEN